jgi:REP element-mobilizing transposase RayT
MPRKRLLVSDFIPYHVTGRGNNREAFPLEPRLTWRIFTDECYLIHALYGAEIHAFTLMPNHFHMLITVPQYDLGKVMDIFMSNVTRTIHLNSGRSGHVFGGPYYWSLINSGGYYSHAYRYVYQNPVRASICSKVEDFPYSTLRGMLGMEHLPFPLYYPRCGHGISLARKNSEQLLNWLNEPVSDEVTQGIRKGLRYREFKSPKDRNTRKSIIPAEEMTQS